jgi:hypothetical protein
MDKVFDTFMIEHQFINTGYEAIVGRLTRAGINVYEDKSEAKGEALFAVLFYEPYPEFSLFWKQGQRLYSHDIDIFSHPGKVTLGTLVINPEDLSLDVAVLNKLETAKIHFERSLGPKSTQRSLEF